VKTEKGVRGEEREREREREREQWVNRVRDRVEDRNGNGLSQISVLHLTLHLKNSLVFKVKFLMLFISQQCALQLQKV
jgi:hypothetical protein